MSIDLNQASADLENQSMTEEESSICNELVKSIPEELGRMFSPLDLLLICRGYAFTKGDRMAESKKAIESIANWRKEIGYSDLLHGMPDGAELYHKNWPEWMGGKDRFGHMIQLIRLDDIDTDAIEATDPLVIQRAQAQKLKAYGIFKERESARTGEQRYKHTLIVDLNGVSMGMVTKGNKRKVIQDIFSVGSNYFPETMHKIYLINAPFVFRAIWKIIKVWLDPVTVSKVMFLGSGDKAITGLEADGIAASEIPSSIGGKHPGLPTVDFIRTLIAEKAISG